MSDAEHKRLNRIAAWKWGGLVVALLASQVGIGVAAIVLAHSDPSVSVVPSYHDKAVLGDRATNLRSQSAALGWKVDLDVESTGPTNRIVWTVRDKLGQLIASPTGEVLLYHHARASEPITFRLEDHPDGLQVDRLGHWQVEMTLDTNEGPATFFSSQELNVATHS